MAYVALYLSLSDQPFTPPKLSIFNREVGEEV